MTRGMDLPIARETEGCGCRAAGTRCGCGCCGTEADKATAEATPS